LLLAGSGIGCATTPQGTQDPADFDDDEYEELAPALQREGFVSSNTYQCAVTVLADTEREALQRGAPLARERAADLLLQETVISSRIGPRGRQEIQRLAENGRVVRVHQEAAERWVVVLQVSKRGLREYLANLY